MPMLAPKGILIHLMSDDYQPIKTQMGKRAKELIRRITAHNGKLGFNWNIQQSRYQSVFKGEGKDPV